MALADSLSFKVNEYDGELIQKIVDRTLAAYERMGAPKRFKDRMAIWMDITACHASGNPLRLEKLLSADDFNFAHDVFGIRDNLDRQTGQLTGFFSPRCSAPQSEAA